MDGGNLPPLRQQLQLLNAILNQALDREQTYRKSLCYYEAYGWLDSLVTRSLESCCHSSCEELNEYLRTRNRNYLRLAVHLMDYNYEYKRMMFSTPKLPTNGDFGVKDFINRLTHTSPTQHADEKVQRLMENLTDPLCVVLPLGNRLLNLALHNHMITCKATPLHHFMDNLNVFENLVQRNEKELR